MTTKTWARREGRYVVEIVKLPVGVKPGVDVFASDLVFDDVTDTDVTCGWLYDNGRYSKPTDMFAAQKGPFAKGDN